MRVWWLQESLEVLAMHHSTRPILWVVATFVVLSLDLIPETTTTQGLLRPGMPPRDPADAKLGRIRGRVVTAGTGMALRRAQVRAIPQRSENSKITATDADGYYELKDLPADRYKRHSSIRRRAG
jgi:hypothetical protein